ALEKSNIAQLALAGGVACNSLLRSRLAEASDKRNLKLFIPPTNLCTDNAAMIVRAGEFYLRSGQRSDFSLSPAPSLSLDSRV
ncbi:MAG: tRNA (adenosine(37)-N6)-threonylcarbamoyltransferase complex transferase subunit TsaD, partial [bacterium]